MASHMKKSGKEYKGVLSSLRSIIQNGDDTSNQFVRKQTTNKHKDRQLLNIIGKVRTQRVREIFLDKLKRNNPYQKPVYFKIRNDKQKDKKRIFGAKGFKTNQYFLSVVYSIDIIFTFVAFVIGTFVGFFSQFRDEDAHSPAVIILLSIAVVMAFLKLLLRSITQTIVDGIAYEYISDIFIGVNSNFIFFIDIGFIAIVITLLTIQKDQIMGLGVATFLISFLRLFTLYQNLKLIEGNFINSFKKEQLFNLFKVGIFNIFFAHFIATILFAMSKLDLQNNWIVAKGFQNQVWYIQYMWGYYWACTIMMTVGFGDILPFTFKQAFIVAFIQLFSCIVLAYNISEIGSIITALRSVQAQYKRKHQIFRRMIKQDRIDQDLQKRIENYLKSEVTIKQMFQFQQQAELVNSFPQGLRDEFIIQANKSIFPELPFFNNLQKTTLLKFTRYFKGGIFYPGEYLFRYQESNEEIMILKSGKVGLAYRKYGSIKNGSIVQQLEINKKQYVNEQNEVQLRSVPVLLNTNFLSRTKIINYDVIAQTYSFAYQLKMEDFSTAIKESQIDSSHYFYIRDKHSLDDNEWQNVECEYCLNRFHYKFVCPKLHYLPINGVVILKNSKLIQNHQSRDQKKHRKRCRSNSCFSYRKDIFKPLQTSRNITISNRTYKTTESKQKKNMSPINIPKKDNSNQHQSKNIVKKNDHCSLHMTQIQKAIKIALDQALTGYKHQFWELQLDKMYNYSNYFAKSNANNFDFSQIKQWQKSKLSKRISI